jgi:poly(A) polymerase
VFLSIVFASKLHKLEKIRHAERDEMNKLLVSANPAKGLDLLVELGLMEWIVPEVLALRGVSQHAQHKERLAPLLRLRKGVLCSTTS